MSKSNRQREGTSHLCSRLLIPPMITLSSTFMDPEVVSLQTKMTLSRPFFRRKRSRVQSSPWNQIVFLGLMDFLVFSSLQFGRSLLTTLPELSSTFSPQVELVTPTWLPWFPKFSLPLLFQTLDQLAFKIFPIRSYPRFWPTGYPLCSHPLLRKTKQSSSRAELYINTLA